MKIYLATWLTERSHGNSLTKKRARARLLSFYFLIDQGITDTHLRQYVKTGRCDTRKKLKET